MTPLGALRHRIRRALEDRFDVPTIPRALDRLAARGFAPRGILDVGAYRGDFARLCLDRWPDAGIACFEPLPARAADLLALRTRGRVTVFRTLLGAAPSDGVVLHEGETASSVLREHQPTAFAERVHPMTTLDLLDMRSELPAPDFLKLDVQGYELEVLRGAERLLARVLVILAEVNLLDIHTGVPLAPELITWLQARGFVPYDICGLTRRPLDDALWQADMLFVREDGTLRRDKRWKA